VLLSSGYSFPHLIQKRRPQLVFVTYLLNCPRITVIRLHSVTAHTHSHKARAYTYMCMCTCTYTCSHTSTYIHIHVRVCTRKHTHTQTHSHMHIQELDYVGLRNNSYVEIEDNIKMFIIYTLNINVSHLIKVNYCMKNFSIF
jgi:hypothetical protein